jgi:hypothetical protein
VLSPLDELPGGHHILQSTPCRVGQYNRLSRPCDEKQQNAVLVHLVHYTRQCHCSRALHLRSHTPSLVDGVMPCSQGITGHFHYGIKIPIETKWKSYANINIWSKVKVESWSWLYEVSTSCIFLMLFKVWKWNKHKKKH